MARRFAGDAAGRRQPQSAARSSRSRPCSAPFGVDDRARRRSSACPSRRRPATTFEENAALKALAAATRQRAAGAGRRFRAGACRRSAAQPGIYSAAGPARTRDFHGRAWSGWTSSAQGVATMATARAHFVACWRWPGRTAHVELSTAGSWPLVWPPRGERRLRLRSRCSMPDGDDARTFGEMRRPGEARDQPPRPRFRQAGGGCFSRWHSPRPGDRAVRVSPDPGVYSIGRSAGRNARIATSTAMSATASIRRAGARPAHRSRPSRRADARTASRTSIFFGGGTPSLMAPDDGRRR